MNKAYVKLFNKKIIRFEITNRKNHLLIRYDFD